MENFTLYIIKWYKAARRELPWRDTTDPYLIWLSEIMLQQTRVQQGLPYYQRFTTRFPDIYSLASAPREEVLKHWQGLGYYSRARNLHEAARQIMEEHQGLFPEEYDKILALKGIGEYTAAAIASIAFKLPRPAIDGNVYRVMSRLLLNPHPVNDPAGKRLISSVLSSLIDAREPGCFNQALMELGALVCLPRNPDCPRCPLAVYCQALKQESQETYPIRLIKRKPAHRYFLYFFILWQEGGENWTLVRERGAGDIWEGLYEFPLLETANENEMPIQKEQYPPGAGLVNPIVLMLSHACKHQLTHQTIHARFLVLRENILLHNIDKQLYKPVQLNELMKLPMSRLMEKILSNNQIMNYLEKMQG